MESFLLQTEPKISDYGLIGNCRTSALISRFGALDWCCFPHFDSPSYFGALLDRRRGGYFGICPSIPFESRQYYLEDTNVLVTEFKTHGGTARVLDCFTVTNEAEKKMELWPPNEILRMVEGIQGHVPLQIHYAPKPVYGMKAFRLEHRGKIGFACMYGRHLVLLNTDFPEKIVHIGDTPEGTEARIHATIRAGEKRYLSMIYSDESPSIVPALEDAAERRLAKTIRYWREWIGRCRYRGRYAGHVRRSALALKLMTFAPSGAVIAAPTTSLPEWIGGVRNWDYRYCWLRDSSFTVRALMLLGYYDEARAYVNWILDTGAAHNADLQILYGIYGEPAPSERELPWLRGYRGSSPARIGNDARKQFQLDIYGEVIDGIYTFARHHEHFDRETRRFLFAVGRKVCEVWRDPDDGIWEQRSGRRHHTHSKVMAWVALDRLIRMNRLFRWKVPVDDYRSNAQAIREAVESRGYDPELRSYVRTFGGKALDASLLVLPLVDYCKGYSPRMLTTIERIRRTLARGDLVYRYREVNDGLPGKEGCFGVCTFWLIDALSKSGRPTEARKLYEAYLARASGTGLWPEEIDPDSGEFLGNYPQGFTHIGLINSAMTLEQEERSAQAA